MTATAFAVKWANNRRNERAASQEHFIDLCRLLDEPTPNEADPRGDWYAFEKGAQKLGGRDGYADVWKKNHFAWEYKGKRKNLDEAYRQLALYREALENPPGLVVCDMDRFEVHTNFTSTPSVVHEFSLKDLRNAPERPLNILRALMREPEKLKPRTTREQITEEAAAQFAELADRLRKRRHEPMDVARFLSRLLFCFFAEDSRLLPKGILARILEGARRDPEQTCAQLRALFARMARKGGGYFGPEYIDWFNGGLFEDDAVLPLRAEDLKVIEEVAELDWSNIEPAILGTLFERGLDPEKRAQLGAHYTDVASIQRVIQPVVIQPLRCEFEAMKERVEGLLARGKKPTKKAKGKENPRRLYLEFLKRLSQVRVLDPACGSGNFLYVTLRELKSLEKEANVWAMGAMKMTGELPQVGPQVVKGIETNSYAAELARVTIWIGEIQWMINNGYGYAKNPILQPLDSIECRDAIVERFESGEAIAPEWPEAEFIVGNPPFLGDKKMRRLLGDDYVSALHTAWEGTVPPGADLVCYWHERARQEIQRGRVRRAGLLATNSVRGGQSRRVLEQIKATGDIFEAWSDLPWVVDGAAVRISIICQDNGAEAIKKLNGEPVKKIGPDLQAQSGSGDLTKAKALKENHGIAFSGITKKGSFDLDEEAAKRLLADGGNPNGRPNSDVVRPWRNGDHITKKRVRKWIIHFAERTLEEAAQYAAPFEHVRKVVRPQRAKSNTAHEKRQWWLLARRAPGFFAAAERLKRFIVTPEVAKHRVFVWMTADMVPDKNLVAIARDDDYCFGCLQSRVHVAWALRLGTSLEDRPRYTSKSTFRTFPFPWPLNTPEHRLSPKQKRHQQKIAAAAQALDEQRQRWLNPEGVDEKQLKKRTLTNLYNQRPTWLENAHRELDRAVLDAYGWPEDIGEDELLKRLLKLNQDRPGLDGSTHDDDEDERLETEGDEVTVAH